MYRRSGVASSRRRSSPKPVIAKLHAESVRIMTTPQMKKLRAELATEVMTSTPEELGRFVAEEKAKWTRVAKAAGIALE